MQNQSLPTPEISFFFTSEDKTSIEINWFAMPENSRGQGLGRKALEAFVAELPETVTYIQLFAAETGNDGRSNGFWEALGFDYLYESFEAEDEQLLGVELTYTMFMNVNGGESKKIPHDTWYAEYEENEN